VAIPAFWYSPPRILARAFCVLYSYVTHKLRERGAEIAHLLLHQGAYMYVCGDGNHMAKGVSGAVLEALVQHGDMSEEEAAMLLQDLKCRRRYLQDIWS
jgi:sulfite reductase alpha subunit-like flavoprotein